MPNPRGDRRHWCPDRRSDWADRITCLPLSQLILFIMCFQWHLRTTTFLLWVEWGTSVPTSCDYIFFYHFQWSNLNNCDPSLSIQLLLSVDCLNSQLRSKAYVGGVVKRKPKSRSVKNLHLKIGFEKDETPLLKKRKKKRRKKKKKNEEVVK